MINQSSLRKAIEDFLTDTDRFVVEVVVKSGNHIHVFLDSDSSITVAHCAAVNRHIESIFDREVEDYDLSVSSAGLDQPIKLLRQYKKHINKEINVLLSDGKKINGVLLSADEKGIEVMQTLKVKKEITEIKNSLLFETIKETKQVIKF